MFKLESFKNLIVSEETLCDHRERDDLPLSYGVDTVENRLEESFLSEPTLGNQSVWNESFFFGTGLDSRPEKGKNSIRGSQEASTHKISLGIYRAASLGFYYERLLETVGGQEDEREGEVCECVEQFTDEIPL